MSQVVMEEEEEEEATCSSSSLLEFGVGRGENTSGGGASSCSSFENSAVVETPTSINDEPFYFESDSLALRNNADYSCLLKTLILLEAQRIKACQDLETLIDAREAALRDPLGFVNTLRTTNSTSPVLPTRQKVYVVPEIDWSKYYSCVDVDDLTSIRNQNAGRAHSLRQTSKLSSSGSTITSSGRPVRATQQQQASTSSSSSSSQRGARNEPKEGTANFNKAWSVEEQRTLEELLIEFPPEDNEAARWRKIATKLGTRTPLQVQSHCQKYFIKLAKAGLPIPGRMPNMKTYVTRRGGRGGGGGGGGGISGAGSGAAARRSVVAMGSGRGAIMNQINSKRMVGRGSSLNEISSMWTSFNPPIVMNDDMDTEESQSHGPISSESTRNFDDADEEDKELSQSVNNEQEEEEEDTNQDNNDDEDEDEIESINFNNARYRGATAAAASSIK